MGRALILEIWDNLTDARDRLSDLARRVKPTAILGDCTGFAELAAEIEDAIQSEYEGVQGVAFAMLAAGAATLGELDRATRYLHAAETAAGSIDRPEERASLLARLLKTAVATGDGCERLAGQVEEAVWEIDDDYVRMRILRNLAPAFREAGDSERCARFVAQISAMAERLYAPWPRAGTWTELAGLMSDHPAQAREFAVKAERTARLVPVDLPKGALAELAAALAITGDQARASLLADDKAVELLSAMESTGQQLGRSVRAAAGDRERVARLVFDVEAKVRHDALQFRRHALGPAVEALAAIGDFDEALRIARGLKDRAVVVVVGALVTAGQQVRAVEVALDTPTPAERAEALGLAATHQHSLAVKAENTARTIANYGVRCAALARLANALSVAPHFDDMTRRLLAEVMTSPAWYLVLPAVARLDPEAIRDLADEVSSRRG